MKFVTLVTAALLAAGGANAATTGFSLTFGDPAETPSRTDINVPEVFLTNTGDMGNILKFTLSLGDTTRNFDFGRGYRETGSYTFLRDPNLDRVSGGLRADSLSYSFTDFGAGEVFRFKFDIDIDTANTFEDYRLSLLDGGSIFVEYEDGVVPTQFVPFSTISSTQNSYTFAASDTAAMSMPSAVPLPAGLPLLLAGLGSLAFLRRKKS